MNIDCWVVEECISTPLLIDAIKNSNRSDTLYEINYLSDFMSLNLDKKMLIAFCGSLQLVRHITNNYFYAPRFYQPDLLKYSCYSNILSDYLLNSDYIILPIGQLDCRVFDLFNSDKLFIRPDSCDKLFNGGIITRDEISIEQKLIYGSIFDSAMNKYHVDINSTPVIISPYYDIDFEWRIFVSSQGIICSSSYKENKTTRTPQEAEELAIAAYELININCFEPPQGIVVDVCYCNNKFYIIELNCINSSGLYDSDCENFVNAIEVMTIENYNDIEGICSSVIRN